MLSCLRYGNTQATQATNRPREGGKKNTLWRYTTTSQDAPKKTSVWRSHLGRRKRDTQLICVDTSFPPPKKTGCTLPPSQRRHRVHEISKASKNRFSMKEAGGCARHLQAPLLLFLLLVPKRRGLPHDPHIESPNRVWFMQQGGRRRPKNHPPRTPRWHPR